MPSVTSTIASSGVEVDARLGVDLLGHDAERRTGGGHHLLRVAAGALDERPEVTGARDGDAPELRVDLQRRRAVTNRSGSLPATIASLSNDSTARALRRARGAGRTASAGATRHGRAGPLPQTSATRRETWPSRCWMISKKSPPWPTGPVLARGDAGAGSTSADGPAAVRGAADAGRDLVSDAADNGDRDKESPYCPETSGYLKGN
jgi:hypothetical protein